MAQNEETTRVGAQPSVEIHSEDSFSPQLPSLQKKLDFNDEAFLLEEQTHLELEEVEKRAEALRDKLRRAKEKRHLQSKVSTPTIRGSLQKINLFIPK